MKKYIFLILNFITFVVHSQVVVMSFGIRASDVDATVPRIGEKLKVDSRGNGCALVKINAPELSDAERNKFKFTAADSSIEVVDVEYRLNEIWMWVSPSQGSVTVKHNKLKDFTFTFPFQLEEKVVYRIMIRSVTSTSTLSIPPNEWIYINGVLVNDDSGAETFSSSSTRKYTVEYTVKKSQKIVEKTDTVDVDSEEITANDSVEIVDNNLPEVVDEPIEPEISEKIEEQDVTEEQETVEKQDFIEEQEIIDEPETEEIETTDELSDLETLEDEDDYEQEEEAIIEQTNSIQNQYFGNMSVVSEPSGAKVYFDKRQVGETPLDLKELPVGTYYLLIIKPGYDTESRTVTVFANKTASLNVKLSNYRNVYVSTDAAGDKVYVDDKYVGYTPININMTFGTHTIKAMRNDMETSTSVTVSQTDVNKRVHLEFSGSRKISVKDVSFEMVYVKGGTITVGCNDDPDECWDYEKPIHRVTLSDYNIGKYEVTQELWQAVMGSNPSFSKGNMLPVESVSWDECQEFIKKLNRLTGMRFALPTEAQWEYAARGGSNNSSFKYSGNDNLEKVAWYDENSDKKTHPVGTKQPNVLGIYDMSGNVWEWCSDWYGYYSSRSLKDPSGPSSGSGRVSRGGSCGSHDGLCRVAARGSNSPNYKSNHLGFRLVLIK